RSMTWSSKARMRDISRSSASASSGAPSARVGGTMSYVTSGPFSRVGGRPGRHAAGVGRAEAGRQVDLGALASAELLEHELRGGAAEERGIARDRAEGGTQELGERDIVAGDEAHLV